MKEENLTFFQMAHSVLASFFGVQSSKNRERDFKNGKAKHFIMMGIFKYRTNKRPIRGRFPH